MNWIIGAVIVLGVVFCAIIITGMLVAIEIYEAGEWRE